MTLAAYNGHEALTFPDYLDLATGKTLHAQPGRTYDVAPASGRVIPEFPEPWFTPVYPTGVAVMASAGPAGEGGGENAGAAAEGDAAPDLSGDEETGGEPGGEDDHSAF